jgi:hypothetical protein
MLAISAEKQEEGFIRIVRSSEFKVRIHHQTTPNSELITPNFV